MRLLHKISDSCWEECNWPRNSVKITPDLHQPLPNKAPSETVAMVVLAMMLESY